MSRKREKPYLSRQVFYSFPKRRRALLPPFVDADGIASEQKPPAPPAAVLVVGLPNDCSVLDLKSRFEIYGAISRIRIDPHGVGFVAFRSKSAADSAVFAALDPSFGITLHSKRVQVMLVSDVKSNGRSENEEGRYSSKLLRAEAPLRRHGRGNLLRSSIFSNVDASTRTSTSTRSSGYSRLLCLQGKGREIIAYDDLL